METVRGKKFKRFKWRVTVQIELCPRCGDGHDDLLMVELDKYIFAGEYFYNCWKHCPTSKEPIIGFYSQEEKRIIEII